MEIACGWLYWCLMTIFPVKKLFHLIVCEHLDSSLDLEFETFWKSELRFWFSHILKVDFLISKIKNTQNEDWN